MSVTRAGLLAALACVAFPAGAAAHYHMLLPDRPAGKTGEPVALTYQLGHPFEHQLFDTARPERLYVLAPDGSKTDLTAALEKVELDGADGKKVAGYRAAFTPERRGDHLVVAVAPAVALDGEKLPVRDVVTVVVHVQTQNGWDRRAGVGDGFPELAPLTRPYGLRPGAAFRAEVEVGETPLAGLLVEVERYNPAVPKDLPPDEQITRVVKTDRAGTATATLDEPGWWAVTAVRDAGGVRRRCTLWVHVDDRAGPGR